MKTFRSHGKPSLNFAVEPHGNYRKGNSMKPTIAVILLALASACSTMQDEQEIEATRDFVVANELAQVDEIRLYEQLNHRVINDYFVTVETRRGDYLVEFNTRCRALTQRDFQPHLVDIRRDPSRVRARFDTIRGCIIGKIYAITEEQREELRQLGDAPGDEIFLPDEVHQEDDGATDTANDESES